MKLIITVDTEEDNWGNFISNGYTLDNIERITALQDLFDEFDAKPTYLVTYPVATDEKSISKLKGFQGEGRCEIGAHCHPWNTPPFAEELNAYNSMLCNLTPDLQYLKLEHLHKEIEKNFGVTPVSYRTGRWGYSTAVAKNLHRLGYKIDTSISPYTDWTSYYGPDFSEISPGHFKFSAEDAFSESQEGQLLEVPVTVGFLQGNFALANYILTKLKKKPLSYFRFAGILDRAGLLNKVWLSPETANSKEMTKLAKKMINLDYPFLNMFFHSTALKANLSPFVRTEADEKEFLLRIREFLSFARDEGIESIKLADTLSEIK